MSRTVLALVRDNHWFLADAGIAEGHKALRPKFPLRFEAADPRKRPVQVGDVADGLHLSQSHRLGMVLLLVQGSFG